MTRIAVALFPGAEELDWAGPWQVLASWSQIWPDDGVSIVTVADALAPITCAKGLRVIPATTWFDDPRPDVLVYPGGRGVDEQMNDERVLARLRALSSAGCLVTSVCTGSLVLAAAGLLHQRPATTHWRHLDRLAAIDPSIDVRPDARFVDDGRIVTSAGVSAGIDMALHLIGRLHTAERAAQVRRRMQYDPHRPAERSETHPS